MTTQATLYAKKKDKNQALATLDEAKSLWQHSGYEASARVVELMEVAGKIKRNFRDFEGSLAAFQEAWTLRESHGTCETPYGGNNLMHIGLGKAFLNDNAGAVASLEEAKVLLESTVENDVGFFVLKLLKNEVDLPAACDGCKATVRVGKWHHDPITKEDWCESCWQRFPNEKQGCVSVRGILDFQHVSYLKDAGIF